MNYLDLFSGIGGFHEGLKQAGFKFEWSGFSEIDKYAKQIYKKHFPESEDLGDVKSITVNSLDNPAKTLYNETKTEVYTMSGKLKKLTESQVQECVCLYEKGLSLQQIGGYFNVSRQSMWDLLRRRITLRPRERSGEKNHFYRDGKSASDKAQNILEYAIRKGVIERKNTCESCGQEKRFKDGRAGIQAHHPDYNKPLDVMWLCQKCHHKWHKRNKPILIKGYNENANTEGGDAITEVRSANGVVQFNGRINLITFGFP